MIQVYIAAEDRLSTSVAERLISEHNDKLQVSVIIPPKGSGELKRKLPNLIKLAESIPIIFLLDLDLKECAPSVIRDWLNQRRKPRSLLFRVAVREIESWVLADREGFSKFAHIPFRKLPENPEELSDPKQTLLNLVSRHSPRQLKSDLVVSYASGVKQGFAYNERLSLFILNDWNPVKASARADSLARARKRLSEL